MCRCQPNPPLFHDIQLFMNLQPKFTYIGGPTALIEWGGVRFLTDPTFDPAGSQSTNGPVTLKKLEKPALSPDALGKVDVVLLSHDHHYDNLDHSGCALLPRAERVLTTPEGSNRLGGNAIGLEVWQSVRVPAPSGGSFTITATPCRHGPAGLDRGPVCGFVLAHSEAADSNLYVTGDTVWYDGVEEVANRFNIQIAVLFMGAARVPVVADAPLTMTAADGIQAARVFPQATIVPLHYEGWAHFSESRDVITNAFERAGLQDRLLWLPNGKTYQV